MVRSVKGFSKDEDGGLQVLRALWDVLETWTFPLSMRNLELVAYDQNYGAGRTKGGDQDSKQRDQETVAIDILGVSKRVERVGIS